MMLNVIVFLEHISFFLYDIFIVDHNKISGFADTMKRDSNIEKLLGCA